MTQTFDPQAFLRFCREKPAGEEYSRYEGLRSCALAQFGVPGVTGSTCRDFGVPRAVYEATVYTRHGPATFGALADRLEKVLGNG